MEKITLTSAIARKDDKGIYWLDAHTQITEEALNDMIQKANGNISIGSLEIKPGKVTMDPTIKKIDIKNQSSGLDGLMDIAFSKMLNVPISDIKFMFSDDFDLSDREIEVSVKEELNFSEKKELVLLKTRLLNTIKNQPK